MDNPPNERITVPTELREKWQEIINLLARLFNNPTNVIMKASSSYMEVFRLNDFHETTYKVGMRAQLPDNFIRQVIDNKERIVTQDVLREEEWNLSFFEKEGFSSFMILPLFWPNNELYGMLCVLERKGRTFTEPEKTLLIQFRELIEAHLEILYQGAELEESIAKEKETEAERAKSGGTTFNLIYNIPSLFVALLNPEGHFRYANKPAINMIDTPRQKLQGKLFWNTPWWKHDSSLRNKVRKKVRRAASGITVQFEGVPHTTQEENVIMDLIFRPIKDDQGKLLGILVIGKDIKAQKQLEEELTTLHEGIQQISQRDKEEEILKHVLKVVRTTLDITYTDVVLKKEDVLHIVTESEQALSNSQWNLPEARKTLLDKALKTGKTIQKGDPSSSNDTSEAHGMSFLAVPFEANSEFQGVLNIVRTSYQPFPQREVLIVELLAQNLVLAIKNLREKKKRVSLQRLDQLRDKFLTMAAHEINTPLTPLRLHIERLLQEYPGPLTPDQKRELNQALKSLQRLERLVNDFRQISKIQTDRIPINPAEHHVATTVEKVVQNYQKVFEEEDINLVKDVPAHLLAHYDEDRIMAVLHNLLENAIDYTRDTIWVKGRKRGKEVWISVKDNGSGIPEEKIEQIFQPFSRVKESRSREEGRFGGMGLGLYICQQILEAHNKDIWVSSTSEEGSTFTFSLPAISREDENSDIK